MTARSPNLFSATLHGIPVTVGHARRDELRAFAGAVEPKLIRDSLRPWALIAIRADGMWPPSVHALGWRIGLLNTWITSDVVSYDADAMAVATKSGNAYQLAGEQAAELPDFLLDHLAYALRTWRYKDVSSLRDEADDVRGD